MDPIYNPYHFIPVSRRSPEQRRHDLPSDLLGTPGAGETTHERYVDGAHSGRLVCKLTTRTPLVVGARQTHPKGKLGEVEGYMVTGPGETEARPAVPASSLRGLISSLAEAASNSALRVLSDNPYSYRQPFGAQYALSALGLLVRGDDGRLQLKPVALPTLQLAERKTGDGRGQFEVPRRFRRIFPRPALKVYWGDYRSIRQNQGYRTSTSGEADHQCRVKQLAYNEQGNLTDDPSLHCKSTRYNPRAFAVAQREDPAAPPRPGFLRVLGCWGDRQGHIPEGKKHELWLPAPADDVEPRPIDPQAIERFHQLADERTETSKDADGPLLPFHPYGTKRNESGEKNDVRFRLKPGDLVYFDVNEGGTVTQVALSAIWRGRVEIDAGEGAGAIEFFQAVDPHLVPFSRSRRQDITIAERMFGFVEEPAPGDQKRTEQALALASHIRFSDGLLAPGVTADQALEPDFVPLRILSSPKPPSPALYFTTGRGSKRWTRKPELRPGKQYPQGRKMYLHHRVQPGTRPWQTKHEKENVEQKNRVRPVRTGQEFFFQVDFDNLTDTELGLLLYALAPDDRFHHKLGMGKPLGLGSVKIEILEFLTVDRRARYSLAGLRAERYATVLRRPFPVAFWAPRDRVVADGLIPKEIHAAICLLGDFAAAPPSEQIHTPTLPDQTDPEEKTFRWFVTNEDNARAGHGDQPQVLQPLTESPNRIPPLGSPGQHRPPAGHSPPRRPRR